MTEAEAIEWLRMFWRWWSITHDSGVYRVWVRTKDGRYDAEAGTLEEAVSAIRDRIE